MPSFFFPDQCPASNTYGGSPPNITVLVEFTSPDGSTTQVLREGVIQRNPNLRIFGAVPPGNPYPDGVLFFNFETIWTDYRNIHVFWTCADLPGNRNMHYAFIEYKRAPIRKSKLRRIVKKLSKMGIDTSRFWKISSRLCN
ncbi:unnamed protein product [Meganyctiphanes norvegica]|uniref:Uncharacterized protein n=1 Tax=Meganyctiphanes norvegica TaxID=48144 RepID=A0AAV2S2V7_MEGNR